MRSRIIAVLLVMAAATGTALADFTANVVTKYGGATQTAKLTVKGKNARLEPNDGSSIVIIRGDKNVTWVLSPKTKTYREMKSAQYGHDSAFYERMSDVRKLGKEKVNGYLCNKYVIPSRTRGVTTTVWVSDELSQEVRVTSQTPKDGYSVDVTNIKKRWIFGTSFNLPKGYKLAK